MEIKYNIPLEVTKTQYAYLINMFDGIIAHRKSEGKFFIKLMIPKYAVHLSNFLKCNP